MSYASVGSLHRNALFSIGLVLFLFIMIINVLLNLVLKREIVSYTHLTRKWVTCRRRIRNWTI